MNNGKKRDSSTDPNRSLRTDDISGAQPTKPRKLVNKSTEHDAYYDYSHDQSEEVQNVRTVAVEVDESNLKGSSYDVVGHRVMPYKGIKWQISSGHRHHRREYAQKDKNPPPKDLATMKGKSSLNNYSQINFDWLPNTRYAKILKASEYRQASQKHSPHDYEKQSLFNSVDQSNAQHTSSIPTIPVLNRNVQQSDSVLPGLNSKESTDY